MSNRAAIARVLKDLPTGLVRWASEPTETLPRLPSGIEPLDAVLGGGWPRGRICLLDGSGRVSLAAATVAVATTRGSLAAWIDGDDSLDPPSLAANGAELSRILWVRGPLTARQAFRAAEEVVRSRCFDVVVVGIPSRQGYTPEWLRLSHASERSRNTVLALAGPCPGAMHVSSYLSQAIWGDGPLLLGARIVAKVNNAEVALELAVKEYFWRSP